MATKYSLTVNNNSKNYGSICVFQTLPDQPDNILSLAWFSKAAHPGTTVEFNWTTDYDFLWSEQGELKTGVIFKASQVIEANPADITKNSVAFTKEYGAYRFAETGQIYQGGNAWHLHGPDNSAWRGIRGNRNVRQRYIRGNGNTELQLCVQAASQILGSIRNLSGWRGYGH